MFIIFGTRQRTTKDRDATTTTSRCGHCKQIVQFEPVKIRRCFALPFEDIRHTLCYAVDK